MTSTETSAATAARPPRRRFRPPVGVRVRARGVAPGGLLGMLALVSAVEFAVARGGGRFVDTVGFSWGVSARAARAEAPGCGVLLLGDSLVKHGLAPRAFERATGRRAYNLATAAGPAPITYVILRRALDAGARPAAVVFDLKPGMLVGGPRYAVRSFSGVLDPREVLDLCLAARNGSFAADLLLGAALPSYRSRHEVRGDLLAALRGETGPLRALHAVALRNWTVNAGAHLATPRPGYDGAVTEAEHETHLSRGFSAHRVNAAYARRLADLAAASGARAYLLLPPFVPALGGRRAETGAEAKYTRFVRSLQARSPGLTVLDARDSGYPPSAFVDPIHLDARGALALSDDVAAVVRDDLHTDGPPSPGRWVRLPAFRARPVPADLEDVELSRARLGPAGAR